MQQNAATIVSIHYLFIFSCFLIYTYFTHKGDLTIKSLALSICVLIMYLKLNTVLRYLLSHLIIKDTSLKSKCLSWLINKQQLSFSAFQFSQEEQPLRSQNPFQEIGRYVKLIRTKQVFA